MTEIPNWTVETLDDDGKPIEWRNLNNGTLIAIHSNDGDGRWEVVGENSQIDTADDIDEARALARDYMLDTAKPSSMV